MKRIHLAAIAGVFLMLGSCSPPDTEESSTATAVHAQREGSQARFVCLTQRASRFGSNTRIVGSVLSWMAR